MYLPVTGTRIFIEVLGNGPAIVLLHGGFGLDHSYFRPYLDSLALKHQLVLVDLRGQGKSDCISEDSPWMDYVSDDLETIRGQLRLDQWSVLGHSGGGLLAGNYLATHPDRVKKMIIVGGFPAYPFAAPEWIAHAQQHPDHATMSGIQMFLDGIENDRQYREAYLKIAPLFFANSELADLTPFENINYRAAPFRTAIKGQPRLNAGEAVRGLRHPTLVIHGNRDYRVPIDEARRWLDYLPQAKFVEVPDAGHYPFIEQPILVTKIIADFMNSP